MRAQCGHLARDMRFGPRPQRRNGLETGRLLENGGWLPM
jgi:hypothetical protein